MTDIISSLKRMAMDCAEAQDDGTSEGAKKGWEHRQHGSQVPLEQNPEWLSMVAKKALAGDKDAMAIAHQYLKGENSEKMLSALFPKANGCAVAEDYGTPEGAKKAAETRKSHGGGSFDPTSPEVERRITALRDGTAQTPSGKMTEEKVSALERYLQNRGIAHQGIRHGGYINMRGASPENVSALQRDLARGVPGGHSYGSVGNPRRGAIQVSGIPMA